MNSLDKYNEAFIDNFGVSKENLIGLEYQSITEWDSVGHMGLIAAIEETFNIMLDTDDIIDFSSYEIGKEILVKYEIAL